jgi:hypothetical protein
MSDSESPERRRNPRFDRVSLVHLVRRGDDGSQEELATGKTLNLSAGGIRLGLDHTLPIGARLELTLLLDDQLVDVTGAVVYRESGDEGQHAVGVEITDLDPDTRAKIEAFLANPPGGDD